MADDPLNTTASPPKAPPKASAKADVDSNLEKQIKELQSQADAEQEAMLKGEQTKWMMPEKGDWNGDVFDYVGMAKPFDRSESNDAFVEAIKDPQSPGVAGDLIVTTLQVDYLACMERSFRLRHTMTRARAITHVCGRKKGHGDNKGPLTQATLEFFRAVVKESKQA